MAMSLAKSYEFFQPEMAKGKIHIIGCGAGGSTIAELLVRFGLTNIVLYDFDIVEPNNIVNQLYTQEDLYKEKVDALLDHLKRINPDLENTVTIRRKGWKSGDKLDGYVFLCVDNIDLRRQIVTENKYNPKILGMFDSRMRLIDGQSYAADWKNSEDVEQLLASMQFTHEEAKSDTPVSACNITLSVAPTVRILSALTVENFVNWLKGDGLKKAIFFNLEGFVFDAF